MYLKGQQLKNSHLYNPPTSFSPALDNMKVVTELVTGLCITADHKRSNLKHLDSTVCPLLFLTSPFVMDRATTHIHIFPLPLLTVSSSHKVYILY